MFCMYTLNIDSDPHRRSCQERTVSTIFSPLCLCLFDFGSNTCCTVEWYQYPAVWLLNKSSIHKPIYSPSLNSRCSVYLCLLRSWRTIFSPGLFFYAYIESPNPKNRFILASSLQNGTQSNEVPMCVCTPTCSLKIPVCAFWRAWVWGTLEYYGHCCTLEWVNLSSLKDGKSSVSVNTELIQNWI